MVMLLKEHIHKFIEFLFLSSDSSTKTVPKLNLFSLKFTEEHTHLEEKYFEFFKTTFRRQAQVSHFIAVFFYSIFSFLDIIFVPELADKFIFIRLAIVVPAIFLTLFLTTKKIFSKYSQFILAVSIFVVASGILAMIAIGGSRVNSFYYPGLILVFIFSFTFVGLKYRLATLVTWLIVLIYEIISIWMNIPWEMLVSNNYFLISTLFFSMIAGYSIEFYRRNEFFIVHLFELEKNRIYVDNLELEERVKERTKELQLAKEKAENANKMKSIFLTQMSHEIRTPINALVSISSLLRYDFEDTASKDQLMSFDIIDKAGERIIRTVDLLLNLSEIQAGTYEPNLTKFNVCTEVISQIVVENKLLAKKKNIELNLTRSIEDDPLLIADHYTVTQIFTQLIDNALKYTEKGQIDIKVFKGENERIVVEIKDTGIGIEKSYLANIFTPFTQEEMGYTRKYEGNGIGLTLVKNYCELNNAKIEIESTKGVGTSIRVIFEN